MKDQPPVATEAEEVIDPLSALVDAEPSGRAASHKKRDAQARFLIKYLETGRHDVSCTFADVGTSVLLSWQRNDKAFQEAYAIARKQVTHLLEDAAIKRATQGVKKAVYWRGTLVGFERVYSDSLLMFLMKNADPERYGEKLDHTHRTPDGKPLQTEVTHRGLSDEAIKDMKTKVFGFKE